MRLTWLSVVVFLFVSAFSLGQDVTITNTADAPGICSGANCTLRQAIGNANSLDLPRIYHIELGPGTFLLDRFELGDESDNNVGDLDVICRLMITGSGTDQTIIDASRSSRHFDVGDLTNVQTGARPKGAFRDDFILILSDLTLRNGLTNNPFLEGESGAPGALGADGEDGRGLSSLTHSGGSIRGLSGAALRCTDVVFTRNQTANGPTGGLGGRGGGFGAIEDAGDGGRGARGTDGGHGGAVYLSGGSRETEGLFTRCSFTLNGTGRGGVGGEGGGGGAGGFGGMSSGVGGAGGRGGDGGHGAAVSTAGKSVFEDCFFRFNLTGGGGAGGDGGFGGVGSLGFADGGEGGYGGRGGEGGSLDGWFDCVRCCFRDCTTGNGGNGGAAKSGNVKGGSGGRGGDGGFAAGFNVISFQTSIFDNQSGTTGSGGAGGTGQGTGEDGEDGTGGRGGAIFSENSIRLTNSSITFCKTGFGLAANQTRGRADGGAVYNEGGAFRASLDVVNSTLSNNTAGKGSAVFLREGSMQMNFCTVGDNKASHTAYTGAIDLLGSGTLDYSNSLVLDNTLPDGLPIDTAFGIVGSGRVDLGNNYVQGVVSNPADARTLPPLVRDFIWPARHPLTNVAAYRDYIDTAEYVISVDNGNSITSFAGGTSDVVGSPRVAGGAPDRGSFELFNGDGSIRIIGCEMVEAPDPGQEGPSGELGFELTVQADVYPLPVRVYYAAYPDLLDGFEIFIASNEARTLRGGVSTIFMSQPASNPGSQAYRLSWDIPASPFSAKP